MYPNNMCIIFILFIFVSIGTIEKSMEEFIKKIRGIYPLSDEAVGILIGHTEKISLSKGVRLVDAGKVERYTYFIVRGLARGFFYQDAKDITIWFASPGMSLLSMNTYMYGRAGYENIELLEDCELLRIENQVFNTLLENHLELANWGRRMSDAAVLKLEKMFMERNFIPAAQRYHSLVANEPEILRKVPLRHIASYLGISQVSLSRIRAGIQ